jgi:hypothetical protein
VNPVNSGFTSFKNNKNIYMACLINSALPLDCMDSIGGVKVAYILAGDITDTTEVAGEITDITGTGSFYEFQLAKDTCFYNETITVSNVNGTVFYQGELTIVLQKMDAEKRNQILLLAANRDLRIVFVDNNNISYIAGLTRGMVMSSGTAATGTAVGDLNGYTLVFQSQEPQSAGILADPLADVVTGITIVNA